MKILAPGKAFVHEKALEFFFFERLESKPVF